MARDVRLDAGITLEEISAAYRAEAVRAHDEGRGMDEIRLNDESNWALVEASQLRAWLRREP